jgi:hypothetical protein
VSASVLRALCAGRIERNRIVAVAHLETGKHLVMVLELRPARIIAEVEMNEPPTREEQRALSEGIQ